MVTIFITNFTQIFLLQASLMMAITASFRIPIAAHSSHLVMQQLFRIIPSTLSLISTIAAVADEWLFYLLPLFFPLLLKWWMQHLTELISLASLPHMFLRFCEPLLDCSLLQSQIQSPLCVWYVVFNSLHCALLLCCMHMTEAPTILVVLSSE